LSGKLEYDEPRVVIRGVLADTDVDYVRNFFRRYRSRILDSGRLVVDFRDSPGIDSVTAVVLQGFCNELRRAGVRVSFENTPRSVMEIFESLSKFESAASDFKNRVSLGETLEFIGRSWYEMASTVAGLGRFLLETLGAFLQVLLTPMKIRWHMILYYMEESGYKAVPIVATLNWLLGVVLGYQAGYQMRIFGAENFMPTLLAYSITWEIGPMLAAVLVAGRSGSAYAAEIGTMKVREEVDALRVMGFDIFNYLVVPKMMALLFVMPFLVLLANISGVLGGMVSGMMFLDLPAGTFVSKLGGAVIPLDILWGMLKSVVYAVIISTVGSYMGMRVRGGASAVGRATTAAVVMSIFMVIFADAMLSLLFVHIRPGLSF